MLGVAGSFAAGFIGSMRDEAPGNQLRPAGFLYSILGATLLIFGGRLLGIG